MPQVQYGGANRPNDANAAGGAEQGCDDLNSSTSNQTGSGSTGPSGPSARDLLIKSFMPPIADDDSQSLAIAEMERVVRENLSATERRIQNAVCPIYGCDDRGKPYLI